MTIEDFKPQLVPGKISVEGSQVVFEAESPAAQIILPIEVIEFLNLCNGENTISQIIHRLYKKRGYVQIKKILLTLKQLSDNHFLQNEEKFNLNDEQPKEKFFYSPFEIRLCLIRRIFNDQKFPALFYFMSMTLIIASIIGFQEMSEFSLSQGLHAPYFFLSFFIATSVFLSIKALKKVVLQLLLTGRSYDVTLNIGPLGVYLDTSSQSLSLNRNPLFSIIYNYIQLTSPLVSLTVIAAFVGYPINSALIFAAAFATLYGSNPFKESKFISEFIVGTEATHSSRDAMLSQKSLVLLLISQIKKSQWTSSLVLGLHVFAAWVVGFFSFFYLTITSFAQTQGSNSSSLISILAFGSFVIFFTSLNTWNIFKFLNKVLNITSWFELSNRKKSKTLYDYNQSYLQNLLQQLPLFADLPTELLNLIIQKSTLHNVPAGFRVIEEDKETNAIFVLISGRMLVSKKLNGKPTNISEILPLSIFGELAIIENRRRGASIISRNDSIILKISADVLMKAFVDSNHQTELSSFKNSILVNQYFNSAPVFRDIDLNTKQYLLQKGQIETYYSGSNLFEQGDYGDSFYFLLRGNCSVSVNNVPAGNIEQFGFFGEISLIADIPRTASVYAATDIVVLKVDRDSFWHLLSENLNLATLLEDITEARISFDVEEIKGSSSIVA